MNNAFSRLLGLVVCFSLILAPFPKSFAEDAPPNEVTSPTGYLHWVQEKAERLFDPQKGCAMVDANGEAHVRNFTSDDFIHGPEESKESVECQKEIAAFQPQWNKAIDIKKQFEEADKSTKKDGQCSDCSTNAKILNTDFLAKEGGLCSKKEKDRINIENAQPKCSLANEFKKDFSVGNILNQFHLSIKNVSQNNGNNCIESLLGSFWKHVIADKDAIKNLGLGLVGAARGLYSAATSKISGLFSAHKQVDATASTSSLLMSGMTSKEIEEAQKDPEKATQGWIEASVQKLEDFLKWTAIHVPELAGIDSEAYIEIWQCSKCGERMNSACKMIGVLGVDAVQYAFANWAMGGVFKGAGAMAKWFGKSAAGRAIAETAAGQAVIKMGGRGIEAFAAVSKRAIDGFSDFMATHPKITKFLLKPVKELTIGVNEKMNKGMDWVGNKLTGNLFVHGGEDAALATASMAAEDAALRNTPGEIGEAVARHPSGSSVTEVAGSGAPLEVSMPRRETAGMIQAERDLPKVAQPVAVNDGFAARARTKAVGKKFEFNSNDIANATETHFEVLPNNKAVKVMTKNGEQYFFVKDADQVEKVLPFGENGDSAFIRMKDGSVHIAQDNREALKIAKKDVAKIEPLLGKQQAESDALLAKDTAENARESGMEAKEKVASEKSPGSTEVDTGDICNHQKINITAGRAW